MDASSSSRSAVRSDPSTTPGIDVRPLAADEVARWFRQAIETFGRRPSDEEVRRAGESISTERAIAAWDGPDLVGTAIALEMRLTVPGGNRLACAGVSLVTVAPTHRRRGILRMMMQRMATDALRRGEAVSALYASEGRIYGRFGYGAAARSVTIDVPADATGLRTAPDPAGSLRLVPRDEAAARLPGIHDRIAARTPGAVGLPASFWRRWTLPDTGDRPTQVAVLGDAGAERGYVVYRTAPNWRDGRPAAPDGALTVDYLAGVDVDAELTLWHYVLSVDLMRRFSARLRPVDDPLLSALEDPFAVAVCEDEPLWVRLLDVGAALSGRGYSADGTVVFDVTDAALPQNEGRWSLEVTGGAPRASRTDERADLRLDVAELASVYLGGTGVRDLCRVGRIRELSAGAAERADGMFRSWPAPWNGQHF